MAAFRARAWSHPAATAATRKRILRTAISDAIVRRDGAIIHAVLHRQSGDHTELQVKQRLNAVGRLKPRIPDDTIALMCELARLMPDRQIARLLNRIGIATGYGNAWTQERVRGFRNHHEIASYRDGEWPERGEITLVAGKPMPLGEVERQQIMQLGPDLALAWSRRRQHRRRARESWVQL